MLNIDCTVERLHKRSYCTHHLYPGSVQYCSDNECNEQPICTGCICVVWNNCCSVLKCICFLSFCLLACWLGTVAARVGCWTTCMLYRRCRKGVEDKVITNCRKMVLDNTANGRKEMSSDSQFYKRSNRWHLLHVTAQERKGVISYSLSSSRTC